MTDHGFLFNMMVYLSAAVIAVPLFARLGLGSVLGYLFAGACIGPWGLGLIANVEDILHFSEFGVVLLLFLIGLELEPRKLLAMHRTLIGVGGTQVLITAALIFAIALPYTDHWQSAAVAGLGLALSSTAIALQSLRERKLLGTAAGRTGFSVLLFQDIAVIPFIAIIPLLGVRSAETSGGLGEALIIVGAIVAIFIVGRFVVHHIFSFVASIQLREIFTALSLLLVIGVAAIMNWIGVSMALGAFLAGVLLANSAYRHALESDIEPFKGLLLGLFFISVGMSIDFGLLSDRPLTIIAITLILVVLKGVILFAISLFAKIPRAERPLFTFVLAQGGEFAFVLLGFAVATGAMDSALADELILAVALSMVITPLLLVLNERCIAPRLAAEESVPDEDITNLENPIIIVGCGRFGQIVGRVLLANQITPTLIDNNPHQLSRVRRFGYKSYYGDALRADVLRSAGAAQARAIVLAIADRDKINQAIELLRTEFPQLKIFVRAYDRDHAMHLIEKQVDGYARETFASALDMGRELLMEFGFDELFAHHVVEKFRELDVATLKQQAEVRDDEQSLIQIAKSASADMKEHFAATAPRANDDK